MVNARTTTWHVINSQHNIDNSYVRNTRLARVRYIIPDGLRLPDG